ncbi:MAG: Crp/Fnr family transcriptional regulator [Clostridiales Family XIII bacterium]|jgi:CRP-like cAMP-binding protein|nr:Crp/Fnr family transcriptional regulator [Clostridiales Family XIII bacterium]
MVTEPLKNFKIFSGLSGKDMALIYEATAPQTLQFDKDVRVLNQGDPVQSIDFLAAGKMVSQKNHIDGHVQLVNSYKPLSVINLEAAASHKGTSPFTVVTITPCTIIRILYNRLIHNPHLPIYIKERLFRNIFAYMANDSIRFMNKSDVLSRRIVKDRILIFLSIVSERDDSNVIDIGMNQSQFAQYLCVDRTTLTEAIGKLRKENKIECEGSKYTLNFIEYDEDRRP